MLRASYTYTASLRSTSLLKLSKKSCVSACGSAHDCATEYSRLDMKKYWELEACLPPSESFTVPFHSVNSAVLIKKYDRCAKCLLSQSCHHCAIFGSMDHAFYTYLRVHARELKCASTCTCAPRAVICTVYTLYASHITRSGVHLTSYADIGKAKNTSMDYYAHCAVKDVLKIF